MFKKLSQLILMLGILLGLFACSSLPTEEDSSSNVKSSVKFTMQNIANSANSNILFSATDEQTPSKVAISYKKSGEGKEETSTTIELTAFGNSYITDDVLSLYEGNYELTKFDVLNDTGETIYSTPVSGSEIATNLDITTPLAHNFEVNEGEISKVDMQVVEVSDTTDPADFGHAAFTFDKVDFNKFYIEVLVLDDSIGWVYTTAQIDVLNSENTNIKTASLDAKMNKVIVANSDSYKITVSKDGYASQEFSSNKDDLAKYEKEAMVVKLKKAEASEETGETGETGETDTTFHKAEWFLVDGELGIQRRSDWWDSLEEQWKKAFNYKVLKLGNITSKPSDENIQAIFNKTEINVDWCGLTNLSGLKHLTNLTNLDCYSNQLSSLKGIENLINLDTLDCFSNQLSSLTGLENCAKLYWLDCHNNQLSNLTGLENCTKLTNLDCYSNQLSSLTGLENCTNLWSLNCGNNQLSSLKGIENCTKLITLWCDYNQLSSLEDIKNLTNLITLDCHNNQLSCLKELENCTKLIKLICDGNQLSNNLEDIKNLTNLTTLWCTGNQLNSLTGLENCINLTYLGCGYNQLSNLTGIENCTNLTTLWCIGNQLSSLKGIENLTNLTELRCSGNKIKNLSELENLTNLTELWCSGNQLSSLTGIENCSNLTSLWCWNNNISEAEITRIKPYLASYCSIDNRNR